MLSAVIGAVIGIGRNASRRMDFVNRMPRDVPACPRLSWASSAEVVMEPDEKACPVCAETIKAGAIKCKWCGEMLEDKPTSHVSTTDPKPTSGGYYLCTTCANRFATASDLSLHRVNAHGKAAMRNTDVVPQKKERRGGLLRAESGSSLTCPR